MAPLPENATSRLFIGYTSQSIRHEMQFRYFGIQTTPNLVQAYTALAAGLAAAMLTPDAIIDARYQNANTNFSIPLVVNPVQGTKSVAGNIWAEDPESAQLSIIGRDNTTGRKAKWLFFTPYNFAATWPTDNRYQPGENSGVDALIAHFQAAAAGAGSMPFPLVSIGGGPLVVYDYANICKNGYWEKEQRN